MSNRNVGRDQQSHKLNNAGYTIATWHDYLNLKLFFIIWIILFIINFYGIPYICFIQSVKGFDQLHQTRLDLISSRSRYYMWRNVWHKYTILHCMACHVPACFASLQPSFLSHLLACFLSPVLVCLSGNGSVWINLLKWWSLDGINSPVWQNTSSKIIDP